MKVSPPLWPPKWKPQNRHWTEPLLSGCSPSPSFPSPFIPVELPRLCVLSRFKLLICFWSQSPAPSLSQTSPPVLFHYPQPSYSVWPNEHHAYVRRVQIVCACCLAVPTLLLPFLSFTVHAHVHLSIPAASVQSNRTSCSFFIGP